MPIQDLAIIRHAARLDTLDTTWKHQSPTPYDTPLAPVGFKQAAASAETIYTSLPSKDQAHEIIIHCSPFLRCVQTGLSVAHYLAVQTNRNVVLRVDAFLGEWQTPDYFSDIIPPPSDNHRALQRSSLAWAAQNVRENVTIDHTWPLTQLGNAGDYGESWSTMYSRFSNGLDNLIEHYQGGSDKTVVLVTHGAGCNPLLGSRLQIPVLFTMGLASFCLLKQRREYMTNGWKLVGVSNDLKSLLVEHGSDKVAQNSAAATFIPSMHANNNNNSTNTSGRKNSIYMPDLSYSSYQRNSNPLVAPAPDLVQSTSTSTSCSSVVDFFSGSDSHPAAPPDRSPTVSIQSLSPGPFSGLHTATGTPNTRSSTPGATTTTPHLKMRHSLLSSAGPTSTANHPTTTTKGFQFETSHAFTFTTSTNTSTDTLDTPTTTSSSLDSGYTTPTTLLPAFKYPSGATTPTTSGTPVVHGTQTLASVSQALDDSDSFYFLGSNQF